ncbi:MAG: hypothetical protein M1812_002159 [Candelaria pacifica]|nr:MAG: hypothetical protein M1812_002159 [Candelaria pacifica]
MLFTTSLLVTAFLASTSVAQYGYGSDSYGASSAASSAASSTTYSTTISAASSSGTGKADTVKMQVVKVGTKNGSLVYEPNDIKAAAGSLIQFQFYPMNHSVVQSTFDQPCVPIANNQPSTPGFFSGFMPVSKNSTIMPIFTIAVNDTKPIWFYCSQGKHCQSGMVGVINAPTTNSSRTVASFKALAAKAPANLSPGQSGSISASGSSASTSASGSSGLGPGSGSGSSGSAGSTASGAGSGTQTTSTGLAQVTASAGNSIFSTSKDTLSAITLAGLVVAYGSWFL